MEFHIARAFRDRFELRDLLFSYTGNVIFGNVAASRRLARQMNDARVAMGGPSAIDDPKAVVHAGQLFAMGLIDELSHAVVERYRKEQDPAVLSDALKWFGERVGTEQIDALLLAFTERFPSVDVYTGKLTAQQWLAGESDGLSHREAALEELLLLWLANQNPAYKPFRLLFDDGVLKQTVPAYMELQADADTYFETRPAFSADTKTLLKALRAPFEASPDSLSGQLDFIREHWSDVLGPAMPRALLAIDTLREEEVAIWMQFNPSGRNMRQHGPVEYGGKEGFAGNEYIGFEEYWEDVVDADGSVTRRRRFRTRSGALVDSHYAADYQAPLNEYEAFSRDDAWMPTVVLMAKSTYVWLEQLSKKHGRHIHRLDQIPREELQLLRDRGMTGLWLIGLWERSRASQTIKRLRGQHDAVASAYSLMDYRIADDLGGDAAYQTLRESATAVGLRLASDMVPNHMGLDSTWVIEHPEWFLRRSESPYPSYSFEGPDLSTDPRVEIKIEDHYFDQTDAAVVYRMRHRDSGGRADYIYHGNDGTTFAWNDTAQLDYSQHAVREHVIQVILDVARRFPIIRFDAAMVLAKAFWLLEGYFVRTLGMHRVYNSAFMVMLRDEENAKYRSYLKKTIEFDPDILKRYVNFMSNPDERTAIDQFGTGDKYFGVATMMATIPGLPMFGHGQIEGYTEKYGMEYKQAKMDEWPNDDLVRRHQAEIAPLLANRALFAESENFVFFDFWTGHGTVDENVFAYSNRLGGERALILYNNAYASTRGTVHHSAASMNKWTGDLWQRSLADALALPASSEFFLAYRDTATGLEYLRRATTLLHNGLTLDLRGYQYAVLLHWRDLRSTAEQPWDRLHDALNGAGVHSLDQALTELRLRPLAGAIRHAVSGEAVGLLSSNAPASQAWAERTRPVFERWAELTGSVVGTPEEYVAALVGLADGARTAVEDARGAQALPPHTHPEALWSPLLAVAALQALPAAEAERDIVDRLGLRSSLAEIFSELGMHGEDSWRTAARVRLAMIGHQLVDSAFWAEGDVYWLAGVNEHEGKTYVNQQALQQLLQWLALTAQMQPGAARVTRASIQEVLAAAKSAGYRYPETIEALTGPKTRKEQSTKQDAARAKPAKTQPKRDSRNIKASTPAATPNGKPNLVKSKAAAKASPVKKTAVRKTASKLASAPATIQSASTLQTPPLEGHPVVDTASIPDLTASGKEAAARKSRAKRSNTPKL